MLTYIGSTVTDATLNAAANIAECEKAHFALYAPILKRVNIDLAACLKSYAIEDKYVLANGTAAIKFICSYALTPLNNVTLCIKSNGLTDAKSINTANNCTIGALNTCFDLVSIVKNI